MFVQLTTDEVTRHEYEVLKLMAKGFSNREIAQQLSRSEETVKSQLKAIYNKLDIRTNQSGGKRISAVLKAKEIGLL